MNVIKATKCPEEVSRREIQSSGKKKHNSTKYKLNKDKKAEE